jgi:hypothetical protein
MEPVGVNDPVFGSKRSAVASAEVASRPPTIRTRPVESSVALWPTRADDISAAVAANVLVAGS